MGVNNRQRRAAKAKQRAKERARRAGGGGWHGPGCRCGERADEPLFTLRERVGMLIDIAAAAARRGDDDDLARIVDRLATARCRAGRWGGGERAALAAGVLWDNGWQPAEVVRHATRADAGAGRVAAAAVAADHTRRDPATLHPRWAAQAQAFALPDVSGTNGWLTAFAIGEGLDRRAIVRAAVIGVGRARWLSGRCRR